MKGQNGAARGQCVYNRGLHWSDFHIALGLALTFAGFGVGVCGLTATMFYRVRRLLAASPLEFASLGACCALAGFLLFVFGTLAA